MKSSSIKQPRYEKCAASSTEILTLTILLLTFLLIGLIQANRLTSIASWQDQIMFVDPAANLYFGDGFTSSTWFSQTKDEFWAGYPPLHSFILYLWMQLFGFGIYTATSLNCFLTVVCAVVLWQSVIRLNIIALARNRLILITLLLLQLAYMSNSEQGRPDILMACLATVGLLVCSVQPSWLRSILLIFLASLFPFAGLALLAYSVVICLLLLVYLRKSFLKSFTAIVIGLLLGSLFIYIFYSANGAWDGFISSIINNPTILSFSQRDKIGGIFGNRILQTLIIVCFTLVIRKFAQGQFNWFSKLSFGLVAIFWIPLGMRLAGAFQFSYSWMLVIPLAVCVCSNLDEFLRNSFDQQFSLPILGSLLIFCIVASPYTNFANLVLNWKSSNYSYIESFVKQDIKDDEWVFSDSISYFAVKQGGRTVVWKPYLNVISLQEKEKISTLIIRPQDLQLLQKKLGGVWHKHGKSLTLEYRGSVTELEIYRRVII